MFKLHPRRNLCEIFVALYVIIFLAKGAFGVIKQDRDFRRFFVRSKDKTETQFFLLAFAFNIMQKEDGKLHPQVCCALLQA